MGIGRICEYCCERRCICAVGDYCGCPKDADCGGSFGWHWKPIPDWPKGRVRMGPAWGVAYERCPRYDEKRKEYRAA